MVHELCNLHLFLDIDPFIDFEGNLEPPRQVKCQGQQQTCLRLLFVSAPKTPTLTVLQPTKRPLLRSAPLWIPSAPCRAKCTRL